MLLTSPTDRTQFRLLLLAAAFLVLDAAALTLAPAVRAREWVVDYRWIHWLGLAVWLVVFAVAHWQTARRLPDRDPYLLPAAALLTGWGLLTIYRLAPNFGLRQTLWLFVAGAVFVLGLRLSPDLGFLRRYKYLWLTGSILLTALTLLAGINPMGSGARLWLGCCGAYFQPSEPLKLLLVGYLAAYLAGRPLTADRRPATAPRPSASASRPSPLTPLLPLLAPTLIMTGLALALLVIQRDLGTATIVLFLYAVVVYTATGRLRIPLVSLIAVGAAGVAGYFLFDVVRLRVEAWLNPWLDPSGRSYQIVQSLLAIANGGLGGRGPGLGNPGLVPVAQSDFIFAAIVEEMGLLGAIGLLGVIGLLAVRGLRAAMLAADPYRRYLAAGLTAYLVGQSVLIIGGNLRLLPLTGVTLPFVSYGGSSLLTVFIALLILVQISAPAAPPPNSALFAGFGGGRETAGVRESLHLGGFLLAGIAAAAIASGWWTFYRGPDLLTRTDNARRAIADRFVQRGALLDRRYTPIVESSGAPGDLVRRSLYAPLGPIVGYTHPVYGQSGLEASLDPYLRGLQGNPGLMVWWHHLLYGQPPPGLDVRLTLDLVLQQAADDTLGERRGAVVLLDAQSGEILALVSHPYFDANTLDETWAALLKEEAAPLFDRASLGEYPAGTAMGPLLWGAINARGETPAAPPSDMTVLASQLGSDDLLSLYDRLGFTTAPLIRLPTAAGSLNTVDDLHASPLQVALAIAPLSAGGVRPAPALVSAVDTPQSGWVLLPPMGLPSPVLPAGAAVAATRLLAQGSLPYWQFVVSIADDAGQAVTWFVGGTLPDWQGAPLVVVVLLEEDDVVVASEIGQSILQAAIR